MSSIVLPHDRAKERTEQFLSDPTINGLYADIAKIYSLSVPRILLQRGEQVKMFYSEETEELANKLRMLIKEHIETYYSDIIQYSL